MGVLIHDELFVWRWNELIDRFHLTSRRPYWCTKTMKWRPYWCTVRELALSYSNISYCFTTPPLGPPITWVKTIYCLNTCLSYTSAVPSYSVTLSLWLRAYIYRVHRLYFLTLDPTTFRYCSTFLSNNYLQNIKKESLTKKRKDTVTLLNCMHG
jgi:hypothetical protein